MFCIVKKEPYFAVTMWEEDFLETDHIAVLQLSQQLKHNERNMKQQN